MRKSDAKTAEAVLKQAFDEEEWLGKLKEAMEPGITWAVLNGAVAEMAVMEAVLNREAKGFDPDQPRVESGRDDSCRSSGEKPKTYDPDEPRDESGRWTEGGGGGTAEKPAGTVKQETQTPKTKSEIAKASAKRVATEIQRYAEDINEAYVAEKVGGEPLPDNEPADVVLEIDGKPQGIEVKTMVDNGNRKITCKTEAQDRKRAWERKNKGVFHTLVIDDHDVFNAKGPGKHDLSQRKLFYRRGYGSFRVDSMYQVKDMAELKQLIAMPKRSLPKGAKSEESAA